MTLYHKPRLRTHNSPNHSKALLAESLQVNKKRNKSRKEDKDWRSNNKRKDNSNKRNYKLRQEQLLRVISNTTHSHLVRKAKCLVEWGRVHQEEILLVACLLLNNMQKKKKKEGEDTSNRKEKKKRRNDDISIHMIYT